MSLRLPPFAALRALEAAARLNSYSRAADELHVTHGAVSHQIRRLEEELGVRLFRREGNEMRPTPAARRLARRVAEALAELHEGMAEMRAQGSARALVISTLPSFARRWLAPRLVARFAAAAPDLELEIRGEDRLADFVTDGVDVAVRYGAGDWPGVAVEPLFRETIFPVCSPALLERRPLERMEDLAGAPLLRQTHRAWSLWFRTVGLDLEEPSSGMIFDDSGLLLDAAAAGLGVALARSGLVADDLANGRLVRPFAGEAEADYGYFLVWREDSPKRATIERFRLWLREELTAEPAAT